MSKNGNQKQVCVKFVRYFSVDKGSNEPVGGRDHSKHIEELKRKYGGDEEHEYSDWDRELIAKIRQ